MLWKHSTSFVSIIYFSFLLSSFIPTLFKESEPMLIESELLHWVLYGAYTEFSNFTEPSLRLVNALWCIILAQLNEYWLSSLQLRRNWFVEKPFWKAVLHLFYTSKNFRTMVWLCDCCDAEYVLFSHLYESDAIPNSIVKFSISAPASSFIT